jgi:hypothetical protein
VTCGSGCGCGCCAGVGQETPLAVWNRPGLSAIAYRVGVHSEFLASMIAGLSASDPDGLGRLGTRDEDDFTIALLDAWAVSADVLTFYTERLAQESYLRTARERISLQELGKLLGYRLNPGAAAQTYVAFALESPPVVPAAASADPGSNPSVVPASVTLEAPLRVQSIPGPGEQPQTFETVEDVVARPEWNAIPASQTLPHTFAHGETTAWLAGTGLNLSPGDVFLLLGTGASDIANERWDVRVLTAVTAYPDQGRTRVDWAPGLGSDDPYVDPAPSPAAYVVRKRLDVYGHNAPNWSSMSPDFKTGYLGLSSQPSSFPGEWPNFTLSPAGANYVDLDGSHADVVVGSWVVLSKPTYRELWRVADVTELNRAEFAVSGKVTRLRLDTGENYGFFQTGTDAPRQVTVYAVSQPLTLTEPPDGSAVADDWVDVDADPDASADADVLAWPAGRSLVVRGTTTDGVEQAEHVVVKTVAVDGAKRRITFQDGLAAGYDRTTVIVHGNVALATHGETVQQLLGSGQASMPFQRFTLAHDPLTYVQSATDASGTVDTLKVLVNDQQWAEAPTLFGAGGRDREYAVRTDENGKTYVQFGDGSSGARLPSGTNNVRAEYRTGLGVGGNVGAGKLAQLIDRPLGVKGVANPAPALGGVDPEPEEDARASIPLGVRTLGRAVSILDYEDYARAYTGVAKASASVLPLRAGRTIVVTVAFSDENPGGDRLDNLTSSLASHGDPHVQVLVLDGTTETFRLALKVAVDPTYEAKAVLAGVETALRAAFSFDARDFVQPVFLSEVDAVAHTVQGVLAVDVDRLYTGSAPSLADRLLAQQAAVDVGGNAIPAGLLVLDGGPLDWLVEMTA